MLIKFAVSNWMSFKEETEFVMSASRERQHRERLPEIKKYQLRLNPIAAIYGGNASGKSNFFRAFQFAKRFIVKGVGVDAKIPVQRYKLDKNSLESPSTFVFEILADSDIYEFSFSITDRQICEEKLIKILARSEHVLYSRVYQEVTFGPELDNDQFYTFLAKGTRSNCLFLTNAISQNADIFRPIYTWFKEKLVLIGPESKFRPFEQYFEEGALLYSLMKEVLPMLDTGISKTGSVEVPIENLALQSELIADLNEQLKEGMPVKINLKDGRSRYIISKKDGELVAQKLITFHTAADGKEIPFEIWEESDGTNRIFDLIPAFFDMAEEKSSKVYIIDEIDRSLHTQMTQALVKAYLCCCSEQSRTQLIMTTHDVMLMDQELFRRDEIWVAERDSQGVSKLISFNDYKDIRYDKDIRKSYLNGKLGGVPQVLLNGRIPRTCFAESVE